VDDPIGSGFAVVVRAYHDGAFRKAKALIQRSAFADGSGPNVSKARVIL
jgi:hypothetical protein